MSLKRELELLIIRHTGIALRNPEPLVQNIINLIRKRETMDQTLVMALKLLTEAAQQFRFYEQQHLAKIGPWREEQQQHGISSEHAQRLDKLINDTYEKSKVNGELAHKIELFVTMPQEATEDALDERIIKAYTAGATAVHDHWVAGNAEKEADFTEAAHDYARSL